VVRLWGIVDALPKKVAVNVKSPLVVALFVALFMLAGNAFAVSKEAQEFMDIQTKVAPDQCELRKLSAEFGAAQKSSDQAKRNELAAKMDAAGKRIAPYDARLVG
jgi:hypothetical protein